MQKYGDWEAIDPPLGEGGQSVVYRARTPDRVAEREKSRLKIMELSKAGFYGRGADEFATACWTYARDEHPGEFGALKIFKIRTGGAPAEQRLKREIAVLHENRQNLPKLLDANEKEHWMVTEYFPSGTLAGALRRYKGDAISALRTFRSLVETVAMSLHRDGIVHRDIKPDNVFIGDGGILVPGDFGIVYLPHSGSRPTFMEERVGPWEYMPQWADLGDRLENVRPNFDVYMLGKLLWCMVAGKARLPREYHRRPQFDLEVAFPNNKYMSLINSILDKCLVETPEECLPSAAELLALVDAILQMIDQGVPLTDSAGQPILPCRICGKGFYRQHQPELRLTQIFDERNMTLSPIHLRVFVCSVCTHYAFFAPNYPTEAAARGWVPYSSQ